MEKETTSIKSYQKIFADTIEHTVESDIILPDYYPEIKKMISCSVFPSVESNTVSGDKISVAGCADIKIVYSTVDDSIYTVWHSSKYTKIIQCIQSNEGDYCKISQNTAAINYKASAPRKIEVKASVAIRCELFHFAEKQIVSLIDDPTVEISYGKSDIFEMSTLSDVDIELKHRIGLPVKKDNVSAILGEKAEIRINEARSVSNKILLKGSTMISLSLITKENEIFRDLRYDLPFTEIKDVFGIRENDDINVVINELFLFPELRSSNTDEKEIEVSVRFKAVIASGKKTEQVFIDDLFSLKGDTQIKGSIQSIPYESKEISEIVRFDLCIDNDQQFNEIVSVAVNNSDITVSESNGKIKLDLRAGLGVYCKDKENKIIYISKIITEELFTEYDKNGVYAFVAFDPDEMRYNHNNDNSIHISGIFKLSGFMVLCNEQQYIEDIIISDNDIKSQEKMILYYASKGEKIWDIAKEFKTPVSVINEINEVNDETVSQNRLLVFSSNR